MISRITNRISQHVERENDRPSVKTNLTDAQLTVSERLTTMH
jgi:hypothetical protein